MDRLAARGPHRRAVAVLAAAATVIVIGVPTDVIPNPVFGRPVDVTWWSYPVLGVTAVLVGLLTATYVRSPDPGAAELDRPGRAGGLGGLLSFFAIGCPTCNKLVLLAVGSSGALDWFAPTQPGLAVISLALLGWALRTRLRNDGPGCRMAV